jgi:hypothetical protein
MRGSVVAKGAKGHRRADGLCSSRCVRWYFPQGGRGRAPGRVVAPRRGIVLAPSGSPWPSTPRGGWRTWPRHGSRRPCTATGSCSPSTRCRPSAAASSRRSSPSRSRPCMTGWPPPAAGAAYRAELDLVVAKIDGGPIRPDYASQAFRNLVRRVGLPASVHVHTLRHSATFGPCTRPSARSRTA